MQSRSITPAVVEPSPAELQNQLKQMIHDGRIFEAFQKVTTDFYLFLAICCYFLTFSSILIGEQALNMSNLEMVLFVCSRVDAQQLFARSPSVFTQAVLLSLIQQLSADLGSKTELKLE